MRRVVVTLLVLATVFVGAGFYLGWFNVSTGTSENSGKSRIDLTIDKGKMESDANRAKEGVQGLGSKSDAPPAGTSK